MTTKNQRKDRIGVVSCSRRRRRRTVSRLAGQLTGWLAGSCGREALCGTVVKRDYFARPRGTGGGFLIAHILWCRPTDQEIRMLPPPRVREQSHKGISSRFCLRPTEINMLAVYIHAPYYIILVWCACETAAGKSSLRRCLNARPWRNNDNNVRKKKKKISLTPLSSAGGAF